MDDDAERLAQLKAERDTDIAALKAKKRERARCDRNRAKLAELAAEKERPEVLTRQRSTRNQRRGER